MSQLIFILTVIATFGFLFYSLSKYYRVMRQLRPYRIADIGKRFVKMLDVAIAQTKILKRPIGWLHAFLFWGFIVILFGSFEMLIDGIAGTERIFGFLGTFYDVIIGLGDVFALIVLVAVIVFILRRTVIKVKRFEGIEMKPRNHFEALLTLGLIFFLMITLIGLNAFYYIWAKQSGHLVGVYPISAFVAKLFANISPETAHTIYKINWWLHIETIFIFANILPYSKHFHVYLSVPNVFLSRLESLGKIDTMKEIQGEIRAMLYGEESQTQEIKRFGVLDSTDVTWKMYFDSLSCTQCGRCTSVCPANNTGKLLSPRKIMMNLRERMQEIMPDLLSKKQIDETKALLGNYITEEELWACTTCNACAFECPVSINQPAIIIDMRRYLVMEKSKAPSGLITAFQNVENNGAPWQFNQQDRLLWAENLTLGNEKIEVPTCQQLQNEGKEIEWLLWVGSAGAFDDRYKKVMQSFVKILHYLKVNYAVLGTEEIDTADFARRAGNEMLYQMQTYQIIDLLKKYNIKKILTCDPHDYNTFKHEYKDFGGEFDVIHHSEFLLEKIKSGQLKLNQKLNGKVATYHDPCYLGRINDIVSQPREVIKATGLKIKEMQRSGKDSFCCGAGGGQMFKEAEKGKKEVFIERTEEALSLKPEIIVTACPFCMTMITDGIKYKNAVESVKNYDLAELIAIDLGL